MPYNNKLVFNDKEFKIFDKVSCSGFYIKHKDGVYIINSNDYLIYGEKKKNIGQFTLFDGKNEIKPNCCGERELVKTYYKIKEQPFKGIIVGFNDVVITAYLGTDYVEEENIIPHDFIFKEPKDIVKCAKICYGNNKFRFVPLNLIK